MDTQTPDLQAVVERLEKVEGRCYALARQNRRLKAAGLAALVLVPLLLLSCGVRKPASREMIPFPEEQGIADVIKTKELQIVDDEGFLFASLGLDEHGPLLALYDNTGRARAALGVWEHRSGLGVYGEKQKSALGAFVLGDRAGIVCRDEKGDIIWQAPPPGDNVASDAPEEAEAEEGPWSLQIVPTASSAKDGAMLDCATKGSHFYVVLTNTSESDLSVWREWCSWGYSCLSFQIALPDGSTFDVRKKPRKWTKNYADPYLVRKGSHFVYAVRFDDRWEGFPEGWENQRVTIGAIFEIGEDRATKQLEVWTGKIESPKLEVDLYKQPPEN